MNWPDDQSEFRRQNAVEELFGDWLALKLYELSSSGLPDLDPGFQKVIEKARSYCEELDIEWSPARIPVLWNYYKNGYR